MNETINCPICGKEHRVINQKGELRKTIYCRCKTNHYHTRIFWVSGAGYYFNDAKLNLFPV